jgi:hypothetical protein
MCRSRLCPEGKCVTRPSCSSYTVTPDRWNVFNNRRFSFDRLRKRAGNLESRHEEGSMVVDPQTRKWGTKYSTLLINYYHDSAASKSTNLTAEMGTTHLTRNPRSHCNRRLNLEKDTLTNLICTR